MSATLAFEIQNVLQMLDLFLELGDKRIILSTDLILADFCHDFLSPISELQSGYGLLWVVNKRTDCRNKRSFRVTAQAIL